MWSQFSDDDSDANDQAMSSDDSDRNDEMNPDMSSDEGEDEGETYPEWLEVQISHTSRWMILQWTRWAKANMRMREEEKKEQMRAHMDMQKALRNNQ